MPRSHGATDLRALSTAKVLRCRRHRIAPELLRCVRAHPCGRDKSNVAGRPRIAGPSLTGTPQPLGLVRNLDGQGLRTPNDRTTGRRHPRPLAIQRPVLRRLSRPAAVERWEASDTSLLWSIRYRSVNV